jgi:hypothetical protein
MTSQYGEWRVVVETPAGMFKICRIFFGADGSYYVTSPYHPRMRAVLWKTTLNYTKQTRTIALRQAIDLAQIRSLGAQLKLAHHPDGFLQFSGKGVLSGRTKDGKIKGIGIQTWSLNRPVYGPAFSLTLRGIEAFEPASATLNPNDVVFTLAETPAVPNTRPELDGVILEGFYFHPLWHRFVRSRNARPTISVTHPSSAVLELRALPATSRCAWPGVIGIEVRREPLWGSASPSPSFVVSGSSGNLRRNKAGELLGDAIFCMYPRRTRLARVRTLDYMPQNVPYKVPPYTDPELPTDPAASVST